MGFRFSRVATLPSKTQGQFSYLDDHSCRIPYLGDSATCCNRAWEGPHSVDEAILGVSRTVAPTVKVGVTAAVCFVVLVSISGDVWIPAASERSGMSRVGRPARASRICENALTASVSGFGNSMSKRAHEEAVFGASKARGP